MSSNFILLLLLTFDQNHIQTNFRFVPWKK